MMNPYDSGANGIQGTLPYQDKQAIVVQEPSDPKAGMIPKLILNAASMGMNAVLPGSGMLLNAAGGAAMGGGGNILPGAQESMQSSANNYFAQQNPFGGGSFF